MRRNKTGENSAPKKNSRGNSRPGQRSEKSGRGKTAGFSSRSKKNSGKYSDSELSSKSERSTERKSQSGSGRKNIYNSGQDRKFGTGEDSPRSYKSRHSSDSGYRRKSSGDNTARFSRNRNENEDSKRGSRNSNEHHSYRDRNSSGSSDRNRDGFNKRNRNSDDNSSGKSKHFKRKYDPDKENKYSRGRKTEGGNGNNSRFKDENKSSSYSEKHNTGYRQKDSNSSETRTSYRKWNNGDRDSGRPNRNYGKDSYSNNDSESRSSSFRSRREESRGGNFNRYSNPGKEGGRNHRNDEGKKSYAKKSDHEFSEIQEGNYGGRLKILMDETEQTPVNTKKNIQPRRKKIVLPSQEENFDKPVRLNKFLSNAGLASRREADVMITSGLVKINGVIVTTLGTKVKPGDIVSYGDQKIKPEKKAYVLLNKPKNVIATTDDPEGRNTVLDLVKDASKERLFPVGRLDRNTTGVLLLTNDGELSQRLTHPRFGTRKIYIATLNEPLTVADRKKLLEGFELEDGEIKADAVEFKDVAEKRVVFVEIHSGRNHIIHRMFESLGYTVEKLDRTWFGGLTKTGLKRGEWRHLTEKEVKLLQRGGS